MTHPCVRSNQTNALFSTDGEYGPNRGCTVSLGMRFREAATCDPSDHLEQVSEFAPESCQRVLSYISGYVSQSFQWCGAEELTFREAGHRRLPGKPAMRKVCS